MRLLPLLLFCLLGTGVRAQSDTLVTPRVLDADFRFPEGVYLSHASLLALEPDLPWEAIDGEMVQLPDDYRVQIQDYGYTTGDLDPDLMPYAISLDGFVYRYVERDVERSFYDFAGLRVLGALSTFQYDTTVQVRRLIRAYNPANGQPFREAYVTRDRTQTQRLVVDMATGRTLPLTRATLLQLCADDADLVRALTNLSEPTPEMLLRAVKLYDDRVKLTLPRPGNSR